jgi:hypothetical protein
MKHPKLRIKKKARLKELRKFKLDINEIVKDCLDDIRPYLIADVMSYLKKRGILYAKKQEKNKKAKKR